MKIRAAKTDEKNGREKSAEKSGEKKEWKNEAEIGAGKSKAKSEGSRGAVKKHRLRKPAEEKSGRRKQKAEIPEDTKRVKTA